jgi:hypothetical protein
MAHSDAGDAQQKAPTDSSRGLVVERDFGVTTVPATRTWRHYFGA